jgi:hypothetical protein
MLQTRALQDLLRLFTPSGDGNLKGGSAHCAEKRGQRGKSRAEPVGALKLPRQGKRVSLARRADRGCLYVYAARNAWWGSRQGSFCHHFAALAPASSSCIQSGCCCSASFIITLRAACRVAGAVS